MITNDDLKNEIQKLRNDIAKTVATKQDLVELEHRLEGLMTRADGRKIMGMLEEVMGELKDLYQEQTIHAQRHDDIESIPIIAQQLYRSKKN